MLGKLILALVCALAAIGYGQATWVFFDRFLETPRIFVAPIVGGMVYLSVWFFRFSHRHRFWSVLEHELIHLFFAWITFRKVHAIHVVRGGGGRAEVDGDNLLIALSPYFFPFLAILILLFKPGIPANLQAVPNFFLGMAWMAHLLHLADEFNPFQPDIRRGGMVVSLLIVAFLNLFFFGMTIAGLAGRWQDLADFWRIGAEAIVALFGLRFAG